MFEYTDTLSVCQDTRYREYTGFLYAVNISISQQANIAILLLLLVRIYREYAGIFEYTANVLQLYRR